MKASSQNAPGPSGSPSGSPSGGSSGAIKPPGGNVCETVLASTPLGSGAAPLDDPEYIGPYRILERIGEGGMGIVYRAEQRHPVRRQVAVKVIKLGMDTKEVVARFDVERQALALMSHSNVAKVYDAGVTEAGRPYFTMEYVAGIPLTHYCNQNKLAIAARLRLFILVCQAVQHAHQKGIIHRDLKPSNILVTVSDGAPLPKVIDFGIAKATTSQLTQQTLHTRAGVLIGTPEYMSPEQALTGGLDVDTRTDIYSLGVILHELLSGRLPIDVKQLKHRDPATIAQLIAEKEPSTPSKALAARRQGDRLAAPGGDTRVSRRDATTAGEFGQTIPEDLDWITLKALEKDRLRRYQSVHELAEDIQRHLQNEPVLARPPSAAYRLRKFARRHRAGVWTGAAIALSLFLGMTAALWGLGRARQERDSAIAARQAEEAQRAAADLARAAADQQRAKAESNAVRAKQEAKKAEAINDFLQQMLASVRPEHARGQQVSVGDILDRAAQRIAAGELAGQPDIEATVRMTLGNTYRLLGLFPSAETQLRAAVDLQRRVYGEGALPVAAGLHDLATTRWAQGAYDDAEKLVRQALAIRRKALGQTHEEVATSLNNLALVLQSKQEFAAAEPIQREALDIQRKLFRGDHVAIARSLNNLAELRRRQGDLKSAGSLHRETLAMRKRLFDAEHPDVAASLNNLALVLTAQNEHAEAERRLREALTIQRKIQGPRHPDLATTLFNLANVLISQDSRAEAEPILREALDIQRQALDREHPHLARTVNTLATLLLAKRDYAAAEPLFLEVHARHAANPKSRPAEQAVVKRLVALYTAWGKPKQAAQWKAKLSQPNPD